ncbi:hypothetical protein [Xylanimonas sp. McL0601]|uniref:hypothetical protein n=1 Tax=Xylanimonas sp. McL0601 TaxID=3414739 RepID=UPI003CF0208B
MSQNPNDERPDAAAEQTDAPQQLDVTEPVDATEPVEIEAGDTQLVEAATPAASETQVLDAAAVEAGDTQPLRPEPARPDDPLSVFDQPVPGQAEDTAAYTAAAYGAPSSGASSYDTPSYATTSYPTPSYTTPAPTTPSYTAPVYEAPAWTPPPPPLVRTTPRTGTIVWGFVILAIGVGALSVAAGASLDVGLAMIYLLAFAGAVLVVASVFGAARRRNRTEPTAGA